MTGHVTTTSAANFPRNAQVEIEFTVTVDGVIVAAFGDRQSAGRAQAVIRQAIRSGEPIPSLDPNGRRA